MDQMVLRPVDRLRPDGSMVRLPWDDRAERGWMRAFVSMLGLSLGMPLRLGTMLTRRDGERGGLIFLVIVSIATAVVSVLPVAIFMMIMSSGFLAAAQGPGGPGGPGGGPGAPQLLGVFSGVIGGMVVISVLLPIVLVVIWAAVAHGVLLMTGEAAGGFRRTFDALCFSGGAWVTSAVPCIGPYLGGPWWVVSAIMTLRNGQGVSTARAIGAALLFPLVSVLTVAGLYIWLMVWAMGMAGAVAAGQIPGPNVPSVQLGWLGDRLVEMRDDTGAFPDHLLRPTARTLMPLGWTFADASFAGESRPVLGEDIDDIGARPAGERMAFVDRAAAALVAPHAPHRVRDSVYLLPGAEIDPDGPFADLWLVAHARAGEAAAWHVRVLGREVRVIAPEQHTEALREQNVRRAEAGLNPIPGMLHLIDEQGLLMDESD